MRSRAAELRERHRRVFRISLGAAILIHVAVFALWPAFRTEPFPGSDREPQADGGGDGEPVYVQLLFGPPEIFERNGQLFRETRRLEADHVLPLPLECVAPGRELRLPARGRLQLRVWKSGRADVTELVESSGSECGDAVITAGADALHYHWLPNERFPAPVELIQPVTLLLTRN